MSNLNNTDRELRHFRNRIMALAVLVLFCFFLLLLRFVWLQVVRHSNYVAQAEENRISIVPTMPSRGSSPIATVWCSPTIILLIRLKSPLPKSRAKWMR